MSMSFFSKLPIHAAARRSTAVLLQYGTAVFTVAVALVLGILLRE
jgi:hypothetical protein